jgi:hypothetical protein
VVLEKIFNRHKLKLLTVFSSQPEEEMEPSYEDFEPSAFGFVRSSLWPCFSLLTPDSREVFVQEVVRREEL